MNVHALIIAAGCALIIILFISFINKWYAHADASAKARQLEQELRETKQDLEYLLYHQYVNRSAEELSGMPFDTFIGEDGLPRVKGSGYSTWGKKYTFYISGTGRAYHTADCRYSISCFPTHALHTGKYTPCSICNPKLPDMSWYSDYKRIKAIKDKYDIP